MRTRNATAPLALLILNGLFSVPAGADGPDEIRITNQDAWNCSQVIGVRPFGIVGKFKGKQPQQACMGLLLAELTTALRTAPGVREVVEVIPEMRTSSPRTSGKWAETSAARLPRLIRLAT